MSALAESSLSISGSALKKPEPEIGDYGRTAETTKLYAAHSSENGFLFWIEKIAERALQKAPTSIPAGKKRQARVAGFGASDAAMGLPSCPSAGFLRSMRSWDTRDFVRAALSGRRCATKTTFSRT